jgi:hypothetical protein
MKPQATQERLGGLFLMIAQARINLGYVDRATGQKMAFPNKCREVFAPAAPAIQAVENDRAIKQYREHDQSWLEIR